MSSTRCSRRSKQAAAQLASRERCRRSVGVPPPAPAAARPTSCKRERAQPCEHSGDLPWLGNCTAQMLGFMTSTAHCRQARQPRCVLLSAARSGRTEAGRASDTAEQFDSVGARAGASLYPMCKCRGCCHQWRCSKRRHPHPRQAPRASRSAAAACCRSGRASRTGEPDWDGVAVRPAMHVCFPQELPKFICALHSLPTNQQALACAGLQLQTTQRHTY